LVNGQTHKKRKKGEVMKQENNKERYEATRMEIILFANSDVVTASYTGEAPGLDNMDTWV